MPLTRKTQLWRRYVLLALIPIAVWGIFHLRAKQRAAANSEKGNLVLQTYRRELKLGITRAQLEQYLRARHTRYDESYLSRQGGAFSDRVKVGEESDDWLCPESYYVNFQFKTAKPVPAGVSSDAQTTDVLRGIELDLLGENCL